MLKGDLIDAQAAAADLAKLLGTRKHQLGAAQLRWVPRQLPAWHQALGPPLLELKVGSARER